MTEIRLLDKITSPSRHKRFSLLNRKFSTRELPISGAIDSKQRNSRVWSDPFRLRGCSRLGPDLTFKVRIIAIIFLLSVLWFQGCYPPRAAAPSYTAPPLQSSEVIKNKVDEWLRQLPARNQEEAEKLFSEMLQAGSPAVYELGRRLATPGQADDSLVRYALDGLVMQCGRPGYEIFRERLADDLLRLTSTAVDDEIKKFLLEEAQYVVGKKHFKLLSPHLKNSALAGYAIEAMLRVKGPELEEILLKNLDNLDRISSEAAGLIIQTLGALRSQQAIPKLRVLAGASDPDIRYPALSALAEIADPSVEPLLASIPIMSSQQERTRALELYLKFARRLAEDGRAGRARTIAEKATEILTDPDDVALRCAALNLLTETAGEKSVPEIIKAIWSDQPAYRKQALTLARKYRWPGLLEVLVSDLPGLPSPNKAAVIEFLGSPENPARTETVEPFLDDLDQTVRLAAIKIFFNWKKEEAITRLLPLLNNSDGEARLILELFRTLRPESYAGRILEYFPQLTDAAKVAVLQGLQDLLQPQWKGVVLAALESKNPDLNKAGIDGLSQVVASDDINWLVESYAYLADPSVSPGYQKAIASAINQISDSSLKQKTFLNLISKKSGKERAELIKLLRLVGGSECLRRVVEFIQDKNPEISGAAVAALSNWPDFEAATHLVNLIKSIDNRTHRYLAFQALARLMKDPAADREQKIGVLNEIKPLVVYPDEKNFLFTAWGNVRDLRALREIAGFFTDDNLRERAAVMACRLARPAAGEERLSGFETIMILKRALTLLRDDLEIEETELYLDGLLRQEGFEPLFNRKDLHGWKGLVGDPVQRARMGPDELRAARLKADEDMRQHWKVVEGVLVFDGRGHNLCTAKDYCDFELWVDWKMELGGDSGIYLRGSPQVQIWDPAQWPEGSGGLYNNQKHPSKPLKCADHPVGTWNTFYIRMIDESVTVYLNGELVVDNVVMENYWEREKPIYRCGQIELQAHNAPLYFKNIYLREIK